MSILNSIINGTWAIDRTHAVAYLPFVQKMIEGGNPSALLPQQQVVSVSYLKTNSMGTTSSTQHGNRIAVMNIKGVVMKDDGLCSSGMESMDRQLKAILNDSSVGGVMFYIDSPGGEASYTLNFASTIANSSKPTLTYTNRLMASAGYWLGSASDEVYASSQNDEIGSIGTMVSFMDFSEKLKQMGVKSLDVFANGSEDKHDRYRQLMKGDEESIALLKTEWLDPINKTFHDSVKSNRSGIDEKSLTGKVYYAQQAIELGLIDGIKSYEDCILRLEEMISSKNSNPLQTKTNTTMEEQIQSVANFLGYESLASVDGQISLSNEDMARIGARLDTAQAEPSANNSEPTEVDPEMKALKDQLTAIAEQNATIITNQTALDSRVAKVEGVAPASTATNTQVPTSTAAASDEEIKIDPWDDPNDPINQATKQRIGG